MPSFIVKHIPALREIPHRTVAVAQLLVNGESLYEAFCTTIRTAGTYADELDAVDDTLIMISQGELLPAKKFKLLKRDRGDQVPDFEIRTRNLRLYLFESPTGKLVVLGGLANKTDQPKDIARLRRLKAAFYAQPDL